MIPTYNKQPVKVQTLQSTQDALPGQAIARGQAQLAGAQSRLSAVKAQGVGIEQRELSARLQQFSNVQTQGIQTQAKILSQGIQDVAKVAGTQNAVNDVNTLNKAVHGVRNSDLTDTEKRHQINVLRGDMGRAYGGIYASAYNSIADANYTNQVKIDAVTRAQQARDAAKGDPEKFKEDWAKYTEEVVSNAPSREVMAAAQLTYDATGTDTYRSIYTSSKAKADKASAKAYKETSKLLSNTYTNAVNTGNVALVENTKANFKAQQDKALAEGAITLKEYDANNQAFETDAYLSNVEYKFDEAIKNGEGPQAYEGFIKSLESNTLNLMQYDPAKISRLRSKMETKLAKEFTTIKKSIDKAYSEGVAPTKEENDRLLSFIGYADKDELYEYRTRNAGLSLYKSISSLPLSKQSEVLARSTTEGLSEPKLKAKAHVDTIIATKKRKANEDAISLGEAEGLYAPTPLDVASLFNPGSLTVEKELEDRASASMLAGRKYDTAKKQFFKPSELIAINSYMDNPSVTPAHKVLMIGRIARATKDSGVLNTAFKQIGDKNDTFTGTARLLQEEQGATATMVLEGTAIINSGFSIGKQAIRTSIYASLPREMLTDVKGSAVLSNSVTAVYTKMMVDKGFDPNELEKGIDEATLTQAKTLVMGAQVKWNDKNVFAPHGVGEDDFEDWLDGVTSTASPVYATSFMTGADIKVSQPSNAIPSAQDMTMDQTKDLLEGATPIRVTKYGYKFMLGAKTVVGNNGKPLIIEYK